MVEAVDEFCREGEWRKGEGSGGDSKGCDYIDNLSPRFCFLLDPGIGLKLRFVNFVDPPQHVISQLFTLS